MNQKRHIILGTDWWTDCDDTAALRMVCRYAKSDVWQFMGVVLNGADLQDVKPYTNYG